MALQVTDFGQWAEATSAPSIGSAFGSAFTFSGLYRISTLDGGTILGVGSSGTSQYIALAMLASGQGFLECSGGGTGDAFAASNFSTGVWNSLVGVQSSSTSRVFYANGVAGTVNATSANPTSAQLDRTTIGALVSNGTHLSTANGDIAECAIWDVALTATEAAALAASVCPLLIRPDHLVFYCPAKGTASAELDLVGGRVLTWGGTSATVPVVAAHPPVAMPPTGPAIAPTSVTTHETVSWSTAWTTRRRASASWATSWLVRARTPGSWATSWITRTRAAAAWSTGWAVRTRAAGSWSTSYVTRRRATASWATSWTTRRRATVSWATGWGTSHRALASWSTSWQVRAHPTITWSTSWVVASPLITLTATSSSTRPLRATRSAPVSLEAHHD